jgi:hypothetical protein
MISIGNKCITRMALDELKLTTKSFPFDYIPTSPVLVLKYLQSRKDFFPPPGVVSNNDGVWFGHFDMSVHMRAQLEETFNRRFERLFNVFNSGEKFLLIYTTEADVYNELNNHINKCLNYIAIRDMAIYIKQNYPNAKFDIVAIHTNDIRMPEKIGDVNIYNYTIMVPPVHLSLNGETHAGETVTLYRAQVVQAYKRIFGLGE